MNVLCQTLTPCAVSSHVKLHQLPRTLNGANIFLQSLATVRSNHNPDFGHINNALTPHTSLRFGNGDQVEFETNATNCQTSQKNGTSLEPGLYIVSTPIGNLQDITLRALNIIKSVGLILAEDTRQSQKLLNYYQINTDIISYHAHNENSRTARIIERLKNGEAIALISDAGTPGISDPGSVLVSAALAAGVRVVPVPGATAFVPALVASGLPTNSFAFFGFLAPKSGPRRQELEKIKSYPHTLIFYAPPHRLCEVLEDMAVVLGGGRRCCVARELTKTHEEMFRSTLSGALEEFKAREARGEIVLVVEGASPPDTPTEEETRQLVTLLLQNGSSVKDTAAEASEVLGLNKKMLYTMALTISLEMKRKGQSTA